MAELPTDTSVAEIELISERMARFLGGREYSGVEAKDLSPGIRLVQVVRSGLRPEVIPVVRSALGVSSAIFNRVIPRQTVASAAQSGKRLSPFLSERILRLAKIYAVAEQSFGSADRAKAWLSEPNPIFDDLRPIELMDTQQGAEEVEDTLIRMMYGVVA